MLKQKLEELGYESDLISSINLENDEKKEICLARVALSKIIKNKNTDLNSYENINKIKAKLAMKGFSYGIINLVLEEVTNDETY